MTYVLRLSVPELSSRSCSPLGLVPGLLIVGPQKTMVRGDLEGLNRCGDALSVAACFQCPQNVTGPALPSGG
ncbi:hypothetical protein ABIE78_004485 [Sinorhizobium fredii]